MRIGWEECDPESGLITRGLGMSCLDHEEGRGPMLGGGKGVYGEIRMKAALYCRVSSEEQASSGYSLGQQLEALREYCQTNGLEVVNGIVLAESEHTEAVEGNHYFPPESVNLELF